jgi:hypothetical protein
MVFGSERGQGHTEHRGHDGQAGVGLVAVRVAHPEDFERGETDGVARGWVHHLVLSFFGFLSRSAVGEGGWVG